MKQKAKSSVYVDEELVAWIDKKVEEKIFGSRNHAFELAAKILKERVELVERFLEEIDRKDSEALREFVKKLDE